MKTSDVIFRWKRADIWTRFLFFLFSIIFHIFFVYYFYTAKFDIKQVKVVKKIIEIRLMNKEKILFPNIRRRKTSQKNQNILNLVPITTSPGYKPGDKKSSQIPQKPDEKKIPFKKGSVTPGKEPLAGEKPGIQKELTQTRERLKASFNPSQYLKPETIEEILRRFEKEKISEGRRPGEPQDASGVSTINKNIVVDHEGKAYFESKGFDITPWAQKVVARINENWFVLPGFKIEEDSVVGIVVIFDKYGEVVSAKIKRPSDVQHLDQSALNAIKLSAPYPHLPEQFPGDQLKAFFLFNYKND
jgi:outer membrane biosynthesis protein TonB